MEMNSFIKVYDNMLPLKSLSVLIKVLNKKIYEKATIRGDGPTSKVDERIRKVTKYQLCNTSKFQTDIKWANVLTLMFKQFIRKYYDELNMPGMEIGQILEIDALKYDKGCFYGYHHDHYEKVPRQLSLIFLLNNDYEGGELEFKNYHSDKSIKIQTMPNRLIIWPSSFLFPHRVNEVTKGTRYSIVSWMY